MSWMAVKYCDQRLCMSVGLSVRSLISTSISCHWHPRDALHHVKRAANKAGRSVW